MTSVWVQSRELEEGCKVKWIPFDDDGWYPSMMIKDGHPNVFTIETIVHHFNSGDIAYITLVEVTAKHGNDSHSYSVSQVKRID